MAEKIRHGNRLDSDALIARKGIGNSLLLSKLTSMDITSMFIIIIMKGMQDGIFMTIDIE